MYDTVTDDPHSVCKAFTSSALEYIPADCIRSALKKRSNDNDYTHFLKCMDALGIPVSREEIDSMLAFDFIIKNTDRHFGNFGFLRNADSLEFVGFAPLFDNGSSLWFDCAARNIRLSRQGSRPFRDLHDKQVELIGSLPPDFARFDDSSIHGLIGDSFSQCPDFDEKRAEAVIDKVLSAASFIRETFF